MPAINVARTDTFEVQRQKINQIGDILSNISAGGSDLQTGNLKLGDGTRSTPSLSFINDPSLGIYRPNEKTIGYVSSSKKILDIEESSIYSFRDLVLQKRQVSTDGSSIFSPGLNYDGGSYTDISLIGGSGEGGVISVDVTAFVGTETPGTNYNPGNYNQIFLEGGSGSGTEVSFNIDGITGEVTNPGSGYSPGAYKNIPVISGSGTGAIVDVFVLDDLNTPTVITGNISGGSGYTTGDYFGVSFFNTPTQTYTVTVVTNPGGGPPTSLLAINGVNQDTLTLVKGNTYRFDLSDSSLSGSSFNISTQDNQLLDADTYAFAYNGSPGDPGAFVDFIIKPFALTETVYYSSDIENGMGSTISIVDGASGSSGSNLQADISIDAGQQLSSVTVNNIGSGYQSGDVLTFIPQDGQGSSASFTVSPITYNGLVNSVSFSDVGQDYLNGDLISFNNTLMYGVGSGFQFEIQSDPGLLSTVSFTTKGNGYVVGDTLSLPGQLSGINATLVQGDTAAVVSSLSGIIVGSSVTQSSGTGSIGTDTVVNSIDELTNSVIFNTPPTISGSAVLTFTPPFGLGSGTPYEFEVTSVGAVEEITVTEGGNGYSVGDILTVDNFLLSQPITYRVITREYQILTFVETVPSSYFTVNDTITSGGTEAQIYEVNTSGGSLVSLKIENISLNPQDLLYKTGDVDPTDIPNVEYTIDTTETLYRFAIDTTGNDPGVFVDTPNLTLYVGSTYIFDTSDSSNTNNRFFLSPFRDGENSPSYLESVSTTLSTLSNQITVSSTTGILVGMAVQKFSGDGDVDVETLVESIDGPTTLTLSKTPTTDGQADLTFKGTQYIEGVEASSSQTQIKITEATPNLYYYSSAQPDMGGVDNQESVLTIDENNPRVFGSGFSLQVDELSVLDMISSDIDEGIFIAQSIETGNIESTQGIITSLESASADISTVTTSNIRSTSPTTSNIDVAANNVNFDSNVNISNKITISKTTGDITSTGKIQSTELNSNNLLKIVDNNIQALQSGDVLLTPTIGKQVQINTTTALVIPAGDTSSRPSQAERKNGSIRFNTETNQYEGYSATNGSWSSLGGVRDLDGNTTILAEEYVGANDNSLWFINDNVNSVRFTRTHQEFINAKSIRSINTSAPDYVTWVANVPVGPGQAIAIGDYVRYKSFVFEVISAGTFGTSGNEPTDTSGNVFTNGTASLRYVTTSAAPLVFEEISNLRIGEGVPLTFDNDLRITKNTIASDVNDITIQPFSEKKVVINATSSLVIPVGDTNQRGAESRGSIRYNTTDSQFEGYNGSQWGGLGGVKDVDQDTKIEAETGPGNDEDILYFFNAGDNTLRITDTQVEFATIDTIVSSETDALNINASTVTFDSLATTIDNTNSTISFITTSKDNLDFGLSTGLNNDHLLRLKDTGEVVFNLGFGTGTPDNLTLLNDDLTNFELKHTRVSTSKIPLVRGTLNSGNSTIYSTTTESSAKVCLTAHNTTTGDKELVEYYVIDDGTDVYFTDYNNVKTGPDLVDTVFDIDPSNNVRITFTLDTGLTVGDNVTVTLIKTVTKR